MFLTDLDDILIGTTQVVKAYLGVNEIYPTNNLVIPSATITSTSNLKSKATVDNEIYASALGIASTSSLGVVGITDKLSSALLDSPTYLSCISSDAIFSLIIESSLEPTFNSVTGGTLVINETTTGVWRVVSTDIITTFKMQPFTITNENISLTSITVVDGHTLTSLGETFRGLPALTTFAWNGVCNVTSLNSSFRDCHNLVNMGLMDTSKVYEFGWAWYGCSSLISFPAINTSMGLRFNGTWYGCSGLTSFPQIDTSNAYWLSNTWLGCSGLTSFPQIDTSKVTLMTYAWAKCTLLESFPWIDTSLVTDFIRIFQDDVNLVCIGGINTTAVGATNIDLLFSGCTSLERPTESDLLEILAGADWTNLYPCPDTGLLTPPIYNLTEILVNPYTIENSSPSGTLFNGILEYVGNSTYPEGTLWYPTSAQYPQDGRIRLYTAGQGYNRINTQWIAPSNSPWTLTGVYNVVKGVSFDMYALHYNGAGYLDLYLADQDNVFSEPATFSGIPYTPPTETYKITDGAPSIVYATEIEYTMGSFIIK